MNIFNSNTNNYTQCIICLCVRDSGNNKFVIINDITMEPRCDCVYPIHRSCIEKWFNINNHSSCILCHRDIELTKSKEDVMCDMLYSCCVYSLRTLAGCMVLFIIYIMVVSVIRSLTVEYS